jgi:HD superfamily phosphohydrolase
MGSRHHASNAILIEGTLKSEPIGLSPMSILDFDDSTREGEVYKYLVSTMIEEDKTFRDPIHFDILVNHLESRVIDTYSFQRLRRTKQLGTTHLVYHGAEHSRFQHSLGVLYVTSLLIEKIKKNRFSEIRVFSRDLTDKERASQEDQALILVARLAGLLHDLTVPPFSHTLEKEGDLLEAQWSNEDAIRELLGPQSEIYRRIVTYAKLLIAQKFADIDSAKCDEYSSRFATSILTYVLMVIKFPNDKTAKFCRKLYGSDPRQGLIDESFLGVASFIVLNTICADLLDYLNRDFYFCGIRKTYDERFLSYACVMKHDHSPVFAYRLINKKGELKSSVLSSMLNTLELRYDLAELVHTHKTKNGFSAMIIEAFNFYWQSLSEGERPAKSNQILRLGDDELLTYLYNNGGDVTKRLVDRYNSRTVYGEAVLFQGWPQPRDNREAIVKHLRHPSERYELEKRIVNWSNDDRLGVGDCLIYVMPDPETMYKPFQAYAVYYRDPSTGRVRIEQLDRIASLLQKYDISSEEKATAEPISNSITSLRTKYGNIWKTSIFIAKDVMELKDMIMGLVDQMFQKCGIKPEITERGNVPSETLAKIEQISLPQARAFPTIAELPETLP